MISEATGIEQKYFEGVYPNPKAISKLGNLVGNSFVLVADFDRCVGDNDTWGTVYEALPQEAKEKDDQAYKRYKEHKNDQLWWEETVHNYHAAGVTSKQIEEKIDTIIPRPGFLEFCRLAQSRDVRLAFVSAGLGNVIDMFIKHHEIKSDLVLANYLETDSDDRIIGFDDSKEIIYDSNKPQIARSHRKLHKLIGERDIVVVGDGVNDAKVVSHGLAFRVGMPQDLTNSERNKFINKSFELNYDAVTGDGSWLPILNIAYRTTNR